MPRAAANTRAANSGGRPSRAESRRKHERILDCAAGQFAQNGYAGTSVAQIALAANVGKPTIYAKYGNKEALFKAALESVLAAHIESAEALDAESDPEQGLALQLAEILSLSLRDEFLGLFRLFLTEGHKFPELVDAFNAANATSVELLLPHIARIKADRGLATSPEAVARLLLAGVNEIVMMTAIAGVDRSRATDRKEAARIVQHVLYGVVRERNPAA